MANSIACSFKTGSAPGMPRQIWLISVLGSASLASLPTAAKSLVLVLSCTWHSIPIVGRYCLCLLATRQRSYIFKSFTKTYQSLFDFSLLELNTIRIFNQFLNQVMGQPDI